MKQLSAIQYDPGTAVSKATTALLAMTALDTTNLRSTVTVPKSGRIYWKIQTTLHGATTYPQVLLGVMESTTVRARKSAMLAGGNLAATTVCAAWAEGTITGLTPGASITLDAAYGVETVVASTGLKYGGPNNTTGNDAWGAISFELWDPDPYTVNSTGQIEANVEKWNTVDVSNLPSNWHSLAVDASGRVTVGSMATGTIAAATFASGAIDATAFAQGAADKVWSTTTRRLSDGTNIVLAKGTGITGFNDLSAAQVNTECDTALSDVGVTSVVTGRIDAAISTRSTYAGADTSGTTTLLSRLTSGRAAGLDNLDATVSSRLSSAGYTAPLDAAGTRSAVGLAAANMDVQLSGIKAKTDELNFAVAGKLDVNLLYVNGVQVVGDGSGTPWGPA